MLSVKLLTGFHEMKLPLKLIKQKNINKNNAYKTYQVHIGQDLAWVTCVFLVSPFALYQHRCRMEWAQFEGAYQEDSHVA